MTIYEQILAGLQTKFQGADPATLTRIAKAKETGVTDDNQVKTIVDGVSFSDVMTSYADFRATEATKTAVTNYEKKHGLKDGKVIEKEPEEKPKETETEKDKTPTEEIPAWAKGLLESNKTLKEKLDGMEAEKSINQRHSEILAKAKEHGVAEKYAKRVFGDIKDDTDVDEYMKTYAQELKEDGITIQTPEAANKPVVNKEAKDVDELASQIKKGTEEYAKTLEKKE